LLKHNVEIKKETARSKGAAITSGGFGINAKYRLCWFGNNT